MIKNFQAIGVIGVGNIGASVVADLVLHGIHATAVDTSEASLRSAQTRILEMVRAAPLLRKGAARLTADESLARLTLTTQLTQVSHCQFIIENVTEDWTVKTPVYEQLDQIAPPHVIFGANTSCLSITRLASFTRRPDKVVGIHFMNPAHLMATAEVIRGRHTSPETLETVRKLFSQLQKEAIVVEDTPGFISNRISHLFMNEAALVLQEGRATAAQIDAIFKKCFAHKMGPLETADLIGLDTVVRSLDALYESFQDPKFRCCDSLRQMVAAGRHGQKSGRGFYEYPHLRNEPARECAPQA